MATYEQMDVFPSSRGDNVYTVKRRLDGEHRGELSCDCPGWRFVRGGTRTCKHVRATAANQNSVDAARAAAIALNRHKRNQPAVQAVAASFVEPVEVSPIDGVRRRRIILEDD